ncbi:MAG: hypothetical protein Q8N02_07015 [Methylotenera sp.]|nr:hypothetical protein [Methylotenera sp.]
MIEAEKLFTETFTSCNSRFAVISSFREISRLGLPVATLHIYDRYLKFADELFNDPQHDKLFIDKQKAYESIGGVEALGTKIRWTQLSRQFFKNIKLHFGAFFCFLFICSCPAERTEQNQIAL